VESATALSDFSETIAPYTLTDPGSYAVQEGAFGGWDEVRTRQAVLLATEDLFRAVTPVDPDLTLRLQLLHGPVPTDLDGRRLNVALGDSGQDSYLGISIRDGANLTWVYPDDSYLAGVSLKTIDGLGSRNGVEIDSVEKATNLFSGTIAHEIGHFWDLGHVSAGTQEPFPVMASGSGPEGIEIPQRLQSREFATWFGSQDQGSSASQLIDQIGLVHRADFNMDGRVDLDDAGILLAQWQADDRLFQDGDANGDHLVDLDDAAILLSAFGKEFGDDGQIVGVMGDPESDLAYDALTEIWDSQTPAPLSGPSQPVIPEPSSLLALAWLGPILLRKRRPHIRNA
jgi:hypothetical protein